MDELSLGTKIIHSARPTCGITTVPTRSAITIRASDMLTKDTTPQIRHLRQDRGHRHGKNNLRDCGWTDCVKIPTPTRRPESSLVTIRERHRPPMPPLIGSMRHAKVLLAVPPGHPGRKGLVKAALWFLVIVP